MRLKQLLHAKLSVPPDVLLPPRPEPAVGILTYHRVAPVHRRDATPLNVRPHVFRRQLQGLLRMGFEPWSLRRLLAANASPAEIPNNVFVVVFDDGYENVYRHAWPILEELSIPASIFAATGYVDGARPCSFDDWGIARRDLGPQFWQPLTTAQCSEMHDSGLVDIGTHTHGHFDFRGQPISFRRDLEQSLDWLHATLGLKDATFSFPYGFHDRAMGDVVRELPLLCGLTAECGRLTPGTDPFNWGRLGAEDWDTARTLAAKLNGWYGCLQSLWRRVRNRQLVSGEHDTGADV